jgi:hypothetical protein
VDCTQAQEATVCKKTTGDPISGSEGILLKATNIIAFIAGVAAVIFLILSGIKYITAQGAPDELSKAKESIIYAVVGIVLIALGRQIITFIISKV